jgi:hypothetical protein
VIIARQKKRWKKDAIRFEDEVIATQRRCYKKQRLVLKEITEALLPLSKRKNGSTMIKVEIY